MTLYSHHETCGICHTSRFCEHFKVPMLKVGSKDYEIHVTLDEDSVHAEGWKSSKIDGDPDLGTGTRYYRTTHADDEAEAFLLVETAELYWPGALRYKIEHIILDRRLQHAGACADTKADPTG